MNDRSTVEDSSRTGPNRHVVDIARRVSYWLKWAAKETWVLCWTRIAARWDLLSGNPEAALLRYGRAIRDTEMARESLSTYRAIGRLIRRYPDRLAAFRVPDIRPRRFLFFIGYSRSGHSLVAALLDAHPDILVAHEMHALKHFEHGAGFAEVVEAVQYNSLFFEHFGRGYSGYSYAVAGQHQGHASHPLVVGDKKANGTARIVKRNIEVIERLRKRLPVPFTFVHVVRNPFDNIASRARRTNTSLEWAARGYLANARIIDELARRQPDSVVHVYLDDLSADPGPTLRRLLGALGIERIDPQYLDDCARIIFEQPDRPSRNVDWSPELRRTIETALLDCTFLRRFVDAAARQP